MNMQGLFNTVISMSLTGAFVILIVFVIRLFLKKAPKKFSYLLWAVVAFRLCCPVALSLPVSIMPETLTSGSVVNEVIDTVQFAEMSESHVPVLEKDYTVINEQSTYEAFSGKLPETSTTQPAVGENKAQPRILAQIQWLPLIWAAGAVAMALHAALSCILLRRKMRTAVRVEGNIWCSEHVRSPFILGYLRPRIYMPYSLDVETKRYVLEHEYCHLRRGDHIINTVAYFILCVHWFNPLCWAAFILMGRDMEMSCDEKVLENFGDIRRDYSMSLLSFAINRRFPAPSPLAFGETGVKTRVKNTLNYKRPAFWIIAAAVIICIAVAVCLLTNPVGMKFDFDVNPIESASALYVENLRDLSSAQISELENRLDGVKRARRSDEYAGFTPSYSITAKRADGTSINVCGYRFDTDSMVDIITDGKRYIVKDEDFCAYLSRVCTGGDTESATDITKLLTAEVIENLGDGSWKSGGLRTSGIYEAGAFEELGGSYDTDFGATVFYGICLYRLYDMDRVCVDEFQTECAITVENGAVTEFWMPGDGAYHDMDIEEKFPPDVGDLILKCDDPYGFYQRYHSILAERCDTDLRMRAGVEKVAFVNIMGLNGYYIESETMPSFYTRCYYTSYGDVGDACIGKSFAYMIDDHISDLDGDGMTELVCNCVYGDGAQRVYVYRMKNGAVERGYLD